MDHTRNDATSLSPRAVVERKHALVDTIHRIYVGPTEHVELLFVALLTGGHVLLEGVPGIAKTTLAKTFAQTLGAGFTRIQFTPDLMPADITGTYILEPTKGTFILRKGPIFSQVILGDEINRAPSKTQSAMLEAMQERQVTIEGTTMSLVEPFMVLATQNPVEQEGVYPLPEAELDRFLFRLVLDYPTYRDEIRMLQLHDQSPAPPREVFTPEEILALRAKADLVHVEEELMAYVVNLVQATRVHPKVALGVSPRGSLMLMQAAKRKALLDGRDYVVPDDVKALVRHLFNHRLIVTPEAELQGITPLHVIDELLGRVSFSQTQRRG